MRILSNPPKSLEDLKLITTLKEKSNDNDLLYSKVIDFIKISTPLLDLVQAGPFKDYTLHNSAHSFKLVHIAGLIIHPDTLAQLSALEISVIIMSCYLHDMGMCLTEHERRRILTSENFKIFLKSNKSIYKKLENKRAKLKKVIDDSEEYLLIETEIYQLQETALSEYLRPLHATRERYDDLLTLIKKDCNSSSVLTIDDYSFEEELIRVCISHNESPNFLLESKGLYNDTFPKDLIICGLSLNTQFCAAVLRIIDILDFDRERTPKIIFHSIGIESKKMPGYHISLSEWNKHLSVHSIKIDGDEIVVSSDSKNPIIEKSIRDFCLIIEKEIRETVAILKSNSALISEKYSLDIPIIVRPQIRSINYVFKDFSIKLDESAIMQILMGENLYKRPEVAIRELIQNSIDACLIRKKLESNYSPNIQVNISMSEDGNQYLTIEDNGIGMDEMVLSNYFLRIGQSFYNSSDFEKVRIKNSINNFSPISRFGIGLLSVFLIGDLLIVETQSSISESQDFKHRRLIIEGTNSLAFVQETGLQKQGTLIKVLLKQKYAGETGQKKLFSFLKENIIRPPFEINVKRLPKPSSIISSNSFAKLNTNSTDDLFSKFNIKSVVIDMGRYSNLLRGTCVLFFGQTEDNKLTYLNKKEYEWGKEPFKRTIILKDYKGGDRITVNGFQMGLKKLGSIFTSHSWFVPSIIDVDVINTDKVKYDVSRDKIIGKGLIVVRKDIVYSIMKALKEKGIYDELAEEAKLFLDKRERNVTPQSALDPKLMEQIKIEIPKDNWATGMHRELALKLGVSNSEVTRHITAMLHMKELKNPNK